MAIGAYIRPVGDPEIGGYETGNRRGGAWVRGRELVKTAHGK